MQAVALALHEEEERLSDLARPLLEDHGGVLDLHPRGAGRVQLPVQRDGLVDEGTVRPDQVQDGHLERPRVPLLLHVVLAVDLHGRAPDVLLRELGQVGWLDVLTEVVAVHADQVVGALLGAESKVMPQEVVENRLKYCFRFSTYDDTTI